VKLKGSNRSVKGWSHYLTIISRVVTSQQGDEDSVESVLLGIDIRDTLPADIKDSQRADVYHRATASDAATVGLVLPITSSMSVRICGKQYVSVCAYFTGYSYVIIYGHFTGKSRPAAVYNAKWRTDRQ